jgi:hypothetical protein
MWRFMTMTLLFLKVYFALLIFGLGNVACLSASAETGSTQAVLALVVLPNSPPLVSKQPSSRQRITPTYQADTQTSQLEKTGLITRQIWIAM